jgi:hypothetical protein
MTVNLYFAPAWRYVYTGLVTKGKDPAAASLGKRGGLARAKKLNPLELSEQGRKAVLARWEKWKKENPAKAATSEKRRQRRNEKQN